MSGVLSDVLGAFHDFNGVFREFCGLFLGVGTLENNEATTEAMGSWYGFSLFLGCAAIAMAWSVWSTWGVQQREETDPKERRFARGVFFRRIQMAALLGLVAILLPMGPIFFLRSLIGKIIYVGAILLLVFWMTMMAIADMLVSRFRNQRLQDAVLAARLQLELAAKRRKESLQMETESESESEIKIETESKSKPESEFATESLKTSEREDGSP